MARHARKLSGSGYLHVIVRGIGKQILFEEPKDNVYYIRLLERFSEETSVSVCAYCLMENHVHLLISDKGADIPLFMKKMGVSYSAYFNKKYERCGHLFQDRYFSEPVTDDAYFLGVLRYILRNPQEAGVCTAGDYPWSSFKLYGRRDSFVDTSFICEMLGSYENYASFIENGEVEFTPLMSAAQKADEKAGRNIRDKLGMTSGTEIQSLDRKERDEAIALLLREGVSIRRIERLTGISRGVIQSISW